MTARGRLEQRLPELMEELAPAHLPDYFDDMLRAAERTPQRPAWRSPERWFPMGVLARPAPLGLPSWRPIILLALLLLATVVGIVALAGSRRPATLPAPLSGLAGNGPVAFSTADGDILLADPANGRVTPLLTGPEHDEGPVYSPDGSRFLFARVTGDGSAALMVANPDGTGVRQVLPPGPLGNWVEWSPDGNRVVVADNISQLDLHLIDVVDATVTTVTVPVNVVAAEWLAGSDRLVLTSDGSGAERTYWLVGSDGTGLEPIATADGSINEPSLSPDGRRLVYTTWEDGPGLQGVIRVHDLATGEDRAVTPPDARYTRLGPQLSPDGTRVVLERYDATDRYTLAVLPLDGGPETLLGMPHPQMAGGARTAWSPDGTQVLATYRDDGTSWLLAADGSSAQQVHAPLGEMFAWQRVAP